MKNSNEVRFQELIQIYKKKYLDDYSKGFKNAGDKKYFEAVFKREVLEKNKSKIYNANNLSVIINDRNTKLWLENMNTADALDEYCKLNNKNSDEVYKWVAEYDAIILVCNEIDIERLKEEQIGSLTQENLKRNTINNLQFKLNERVLNKINFIRIINVLSELRAFKYEDGTYPSKKDVMEIFGNVVDIDLRQYSKDLSKSMKNSTIETNLAIFKEMEEKMTSIWSSKLDEG